MNSHFIKDTCSRFPSALGHTPVGKAVVNFSEPVMHALACSTCMECMLVQPVQIFVDSVFNFV